MEVMDMTVDYDLAKICRSCRRDDANLQSIFDNVGPNGIILTEMLVNCTHVQLNYNDGMPPNICVSCVNDICVAYNFRKRFEQSDMMLREYISRQKVPSSEGDAVKVELFDIKPDITFIDADPLVGEKCFPVTIVSDGRQEHSAEVQEIPLDKEIIEELVEDDYDGAEVTIDSCVEDEEHGDLTDAENDKDPDVEFNEDSLDDIIEELKPRKLRAGRKYNGYSKVKGKFACSSCDRIFTDKRGITNHVKQHVPKDIKACTVCGRAFTTSYHLSRHMRIHENPIQCNHCENKLATPADYRQHMAAEHPGLESISHSPGLELTLTLTSDLTEEKGKLEAICRICDTTFDRIAELRNHLKSHVDPKSYADVNIHTKPYLFEEGYVLENYHEYLVQQICKWDVLRFHQIVEPDGDELELSDSDSEIEDGAPSIEGIVRREHVCALCNQIFPRIKAIMEHTKDQHSQEELFTCRHCARGFPNTSLLVRHLKQQCENHHKKFLCTFCNEKFMWQTSLNKHAQHKHKPTKPLWERSEITNESPDDKEKRFVCQVCTKGFQRLEHLDRHIKIHIPSEKKFECTQCHKKFNRKDNLRSHMKIHKKDPELINKQNHLCVYCGRGFSNSSNLIVHMRRHTGERPYKCDICDKGFPRSSDLQCHRRTHTGEKPCLCTICGKGFSRSNKLVRHMRIHTGARPYSCTYCDRAFTQSNDLTLHIRRHTGEKPYLCGVCNERFIQGTALKAHQRVTGHFDDGTHQPERFASISVNNPNRLGINGPKAVRQNTSGSDGTAPRIVKPVKSRKKASNKTGQANPVTLAASDAAEPPTVPANTATTLATCAVDSEPASPGEGSAASRAELQSLTVPAHGYVTVPYIMQNYDLTSTGLFSQNFSQQ